MHMNSLINQELPHSDVEINRTDEKYSSQPPSSEQNSLLKKPEENRKTNDFNRVLDSIGGFGKLQKVSL